MAATNLSSDELKGVAEISGLLKNLSKIVGEDTLNEIRFYEEAAAETTAAERAKKSQVYTPKSEIEKFM